MILASRVDSKAQLWYSDAPWSHTHPTRQSHPPPAPIHHRHNLDDDSTEEESDAGYPRLFCQTHSQISLWCLLPASDCRNYFSHRASPKFNSPKSLSVFVDRPPNTAATESSGPRTQRHSAGHSRGSGPLQSSGRRCPTLQIQLSLSLWFQDEQNRGRGFLPPTKWKTNHLFCDGFRQTIHERYERFKKSCKKWSKCKFCLSLSNPLLPDYQRKHRDPPPNVSNQNEWILILKKTNVLEKQPNQRVAGAMEFRSISGSELQLRSKLPSRHLRMPQRPMDSALICEFESET